MRVAKSLLAFVCSVTMFGQQIDYNTQIRNKPPTTVYDARVYNFAALTPGVPLTASVPATVTLAPAPAGVVAGDTNETFYLSGGTGSPEAVSLQSGGTCLGTGQTICTVTFTPANNHTGAWAISSASSGIQEAVTTACNAGSGGTIYLHTGTIKAYDNVTIWCGLRITGDGAASTLVVGQNPAIGIFLVNVANPVSFDNFQITSVSQQSSTAYGIELTAPSGGSNTNSLIDSMWITNTYTGVLGVNATGFTVTRSTILNFAFSGIIADDQNTQDADGPKIIGNAFQNFTGPAIADSAFLIRSTGGIVFSNNSVGGGGTGTTNYLNQGVHLLSHVSSGLLIDDNDIENTGLAAISLDGTYVLVTVTNNHMVQFSGITMDPNVWWGLIVSNGTGSGITQGVISGNVINGIGSSSANVGMVIQGGSQFINVGPNQISNVGNAVEVSAAFNITVGPQQVSATGTCISNLILTTSTTLNFTCPTTFALLPAVANGSQLYCSDCNSTCTAGSSNGRTCFMENSAWTH